MKNGKRFEECDSFSFSVILPCSYFLCWPFSVNEAQGRLVPAASDTVPVYTEEQALEPPSVLFSMYVNIVHVKHTDKWKHKCHFNLCFIWNNLHTSLQCYRKYDFLVINEWNRSIYSLVLLGQAVQYTHKNIINS